MMVTGIPAMKAWLSHPSEGAHTLIRSINVYVISLRYYQEQANQSMDISKWAEQKDKD